MLPGEVRSFTRRTRHIEGWFLPAAAALFGLLDEVQRAAAIGGDLFEIGVHHGRSAVVLCAMAGAEESVGVCDLFANQARNASASGSGDREIFETNLAYAVPDFDRIRVFAKLSSELTPSEVGGPQRLFHVDGGHLRDEALADLRLAATVLHKDGAIVVDDPFQPMWPGVTEAILSFLAERSDFVPLVLGFNKLVLVPRAAREAYEPSIASPKTLWSYFDRRIHDAKTLPILGEPTRIIFTPSWLQRPELELAFARFLSLRGAVLHRARRHLRSALPTP
jgi:hypothetical protein